MKLISNVVVKIKDFIDKYKFKSFVSKMMERIVKKIRSGGPITQAYAARTVKRRYKAGLQTGFVDLTGNKTYDRRSSRLLNNYTVVAVSPTQADVIWKDAKDRVILGYLLSKYKRVFELAEEQSREERK